MADWTNPGLSSLYGTFLTELKDRDLDLAYMFDVGSPTNVPTNAVRFDKTNGRFQAWNGSAWETKPLAVVGGGTGGTDTASARTGLGLGTIATQAASNVAITGGSISGVALSSVSLLSLADAAQARANLGLAIGSDVQAYDDDLAALAGLATAADKMAYFTGSHAAALTTLTATARALLDDGDAAAMRSTLGLGTLAVLNSGTTSGTVPVIDSNGDLPPIGGKNLTGIVSIPTGVWMSYIGATAPAGWVLASGRTIGDASSAATERANADCHDLFVLIWNNWADAQAPVSSGRGGSAEADWGAHKRITVPDLRGRVAAGRDNMGGTAANRLITALTGSTLGATGGEETHLLTAAESGSPSHGHTATSTVTANDASSVSGGHGDNGYPVNSYQGPHAFSSTITVSTTVNASSAANAASAHNNVQHTIASTIIIKL